MNWTERNTADLWCDLLDQRYRKKNKEQEGLQQIDLQRDGFQAVEAKLDSYFLKTTNGRIENEKKTRETAATAVEICVVLSNSAKDAAFASLLQQLINITD